MTHRIEQEPRMFSPMDRRHFLSVALVAGTTLLHGCSRPRKLQDTHGTDLSDANIGRDFLLTGTDGRQHDLADFKGKIVLIFFGFTQCPDICPTALFRATQIKEILGQDGNLLQVLFITIDPERDTPQVLKSYVSAFDPGFMGLHGNFDQTAKTAREFKAYYAKVPTGSSYTMDHTALTYAYDRSGHLRLGLGYELTAEECAEDIRKILALD